MIKIGTNDDFEHSKKLSFVANGSNISRNPKDFYITHNEVVHKMR